MPLPSNTSPRYLVVATNQKGILDAATMLRREPSEFSLLFAEDQFDGDEPKIVLIHPTAKFLENYAELVELYQRMVSQGRAKLFNISTKS